MDVTTDQWTGRTTKAPCGCRAGDGIALWKPDGVDCARPSCAVGPDDPGDPGFVAIPRADLAAILEGLQAIERAGDRLDQVADRLLDAVNSLTLGRFPEDF